MDLWNAFGHAEKRAAPRFVANFDVLYGAGQELTLGTALEISELGIAFCSSKSYPLGSKLSVRCFLDESRFMEAECVVTRVEDGKIAAEFRRLSRSDYNELLAFLEHATHCGKPVVAEHLSYLRRSDERMTAC